MFQFFVENMGIFSKLPIREIMVAAVLGVASGLYIFAPGIIEFSSKVQNKNIDKIEHSQSQDVKFK